MTDGLLFASLFVLSGFALLLLQVVSYDALQALHGIARDIETAFGTDSIIYPDYQP